MCIQPDADEIIDMFLKNARESEHYHTFAFCTNSEVFAGVPERAAEKELKESLEAWSKKWMKVNVYEWVGKPKIMVSILKFIPEKIKSAVSDFNRLPYIHKLRFIG